MQKELKQTISESLSAEEHAKHLDQILASEELSVTRLERELGQLKQRQFSCSQQHFDLKAKVEMMEADLQGGRTSVRNLGSVQQTLDDQLLKQDEIMYVQDFQLQQLHHRLRRLEGERWGEEADLLNNKIKVSQPVSQPLAMSC